MSNAAKQDAVEAKNMKRASNRASMRGETSAADNMLRDGAEVVDENDFESF
jgi:hypothetical protein